MIEDKVVAVVGGDAAVGRPMRDWIQLEIGVDQMRPGVYYQVSASATWT